MKPGKGTGKALRRIVSVLQRRIDDFGISLGQLLTGKGQAAHTDIIAERIAAENAEHALKMKR